MDRSSGPDTQSVRLIVHTSHAGYVHWSVILEKRRRGTNTRHLLARGRVQLPPGIPPGEGATTALDVAMAELLYQEGGGTAAPVIGVPWGTIGGTPRGLDIAARLKSASPPPPGQSPAQPVLFDLE